MKNKQGAKRQAFKQQCKKALFKDVFVSTTIVTSIFLFIISVVKPTSN